MLVDAIGNAHDRVRETARIVSLVPSLTELLFDLDLGDQLVARTAFCSEPRDRVEPVPIVGGTKKVSLRRLRALDPTHVLVNVDETPKALAEEIAAMGIDVVVTHPLRPADNLALFRLFGHIFDREKEAEALASTLTHRLNEACARRPTLPARDVLYFIWKEPWMTVSRNTYVAAMLELFGYRTLGHDAEKRYPELTLTPGLLQQADMILFASEPYNFTQADIDNFRATNEPDATTFLCTIDGSMTSWYGSRAIAALDYLKDFRDRTDGCRRQF